MRIHLASDHRGYTLAREIEVALSLSGHETIWHGPAEFDDGDDYPVFVIAAARAVVQDEDSGVDARAIVVGATGAGETVTANKVNGARAVPGLTLDFVRAARRHADADVLALGAITIDAALELAGAFIEEPFSLDQHDVRRVMHTAEFENAGTVE